MSIKIFVHTPFQVLCAAEFIASRDRLVPRSASDACTVFLFPTGTLNWQQSKATVERLNLPYRTLGGPRPLQWSGKIQKMLDLRRELARLAPSDVLVVGNPGLQIFSNALARAACERWVLDDGLMTVHYLQALQKNSAGGYEISESMLSQSIARAIFGMRRTPDWSAIRWFTIFARNFPGMPNVFQNDLEGMHGRYSRSETETSVLFLGSPLVSGRILTVEDYDYLCRNIVRSLRTRYPDCRLVYLCHRGERKIDSTVHQYFDEVQSSLGPVELRWLGRNEGLPRAVAGIMSTALISLSKILPAETKVYAYWPATRFLDRQLDAEKLLALFEAVQGAGKLDVVRVGVDQCNEALLPKE